MRILITRPEPGASETAGRLRALGHDPVLSPVSLLRPIAASLPAGPIDAVVVSSANALRSLDAAALEQIRLLPVFTVGDATARIARDLGLDAIAGPGTAGHLSKTVATRCAPAATLLYLAGEPRKPDLERAFAARGFRLHLALCYRMEPATALSVQAVTTLRAGTIDAVLHYSRESAARLSALATASGCVQALHRPRHLCMSADVADGLLMASPLRVAIAAHPTEDGLLSLLDKAN